METAQASSTVLIWRTYPSIEACAHWVWLMIRIAEKLGFMKVRALAVCAKTGIVSSSDQKIRAFV
jgi:hypothetical protein